MKIIIAALIISGCLSGSSLAISFETGGYSIDLPGYVERSDKTKNRIAQKRAWSAKRDVAFSAGTFKHPKAGLELHVAALLAHSVLEKAAFLKYTSQMGMDEETAMKVYEELGGRRGSTVKVTSFTRVRVGKRSGWHLMTRNHEKGLWIQNFFLPGRQPREIVQITFGGEAPDLKNKDAYLRLIKG